jgi:hypothetical protein
MLLPSSLHNFMMLWKYKYDDLQPSEGAMDASAPYVVKHHQHNSLDTLFKSYAFSFFLVELNAHGCNQANTSKDN